MATMTTAPEEIKAACPRCGDRFKTWWRGSMNLTWEHFDEKYIQEMTTARCPGCNLRFELDAIVVRSPGVWDVQAGLRRKIRRYRFQRTHDEIIGDLLCLLKGSASDGGIGIFANDACWSWSVLPGKYTTRYQSASVVAARSGTDSPALRHDHAVPRKLLVERIFEQRHSWSEESLRALFERFCLGVVLNQSEDRKLDGKRLRQNMPAGWTWNFGEPLARYIAADIPLVDTWE